jgi:hypothetical protein
MTTTNPPAEGVSPMTTETAATRQITDTEGRTWTAVADGTVVAHRRKGARLAFRLEGDAATLLVTKIEFNSDIAAEQAIATMSEHELRRRLQWAKTDAGIR